MKPKIDVTMIGFREVVKNLQQITGKTFREVVDAEAGHILRNTIDKIPKATTAKIIKYTLPEGINYKRGTGGRKVTIDDDGKLYHVGKPVIDTISTAHSSGTKYKYPKGRWMGQKGKNNKRFARYVQKQKAKATERILRKGLSASQFYAISVALNLPLPKKPPAYITKASHYQIIKKFIGNSNRKGFGSIYQLALGSKGLRFSRPTRAQANLTNSVNRRKKFFIDRIQGRTPKALKKFMPKNYPLLFR